MRVFAFGKGPELRGPRSADIAGDLALHRCGRRPGTLAEGKDMQVRDRQVGDIIIGVVKFPVRLSRKTGDHIKADRGGVIEAILVSNEEPVEFDQPLFTLI